MPRETLQQQVSEIRVQVYPPKKPFGGHHPIFTEDVAGFLTTVIPAMGAQPSPPNPPQPQAVEEQYEVTERRAIATTTTPTYYDLETIEPKQVLLIAEGDDHLVDFNRQITTDSPKIFASGSLSITAKGITRIWMQAVTSTGTIRILVMSR